MKTISLMIISAVVFTLAGCSTPQPALDQANNTAALAVSLQQSLDQLRTTQSAAAKSRVDSIESMNELVATLDAERSWRNDIQELSGNGEKLKLIADLKKRAQARANVESAAAKAIADKKAETAKLVSPLPDSSEKLKKLQESLGALGEEMSHRDRIEVVSKFAQSLRKTVLENRSKAAEKVESAKKLTPEASKGD